jgi:hypothetical protein
MLVIAMIAIGLAGLLEWRQASGQPTSAAVRLARTILAERSSRGPYGATPPDLMSLSIFSLTGFAAWRSVRAIASRKPDPA